MARTRSIGIEIAGLAFPTPVLVASGCGGTGKELQGLVELKRRYDPENLFRMNQKIAPA